LLQLVAAGCPLRSSGAPAVGAQVAAPVTERAGDTKQRIRRTVPDLPLGNLTVAVLKSRLQMHGGAMFVLDDKTRHNIREKQRFFSYPKRYEIDP